MLLKSNFEYIEPEDFNNIVVIIRGLEYENSEEVPDYDSERDAVDKYFALIDRSKLDYYPDIFDKAAHLFININSHYFSNGNKRLSVTSTAYFLEKNGHVPSNLSKKNYESILSKLFGNFKLSDWDRFEAQDFGLYNLALIIAKKNEKNHLEISNDELKNKIKQFFEKTFEIQS